MLVRFADDQVRMNTELSKPSLKLSDEKRYSQSALFEFIRKNLADIAGPQVVGVITIPSPFIPLLDFLELVPREMSFVWNNPPSGTSFAGGGVAHCIKVSGHNRLLQLREQSETLWNGIRSIRHPDAPDYAPRLFGGLAFSPGNSQGSPWTEFGDGTFTLPSWTYGCTGKDCFLSLAARFDKDGGLSGKNKILKDLKAILKDLFDHQGSSVSKTNPVPARMIPASNLSQFPLAEWGKHIQKIRRTIESGRFRKIVSARRCDVRLKDGLKDIVVLDRLTAEPKCTHFAFRRERTSFLGASPELLFLKSGLNLRTQALAGTIGSTDSRSCPPQIQSKRLLKSQKDRKEQEFVVAAIRDSLRPLCMEVSVANEPEILDLPNILHINTPFEAKLLPTTHTTDILEVLHPTPAVGGVPRKAAQEWIVKNEFEERGWYTGPVGWLDARGDSEFTVSIRCGVLADNYAYLFTGAGVVYNSDPEAEYEETALKQLPMLRALGVKLER